MLIKCFHIYIHTYIHVLLNKKIKIIFVDNYGTREYIDTGPLSNVLKNIEGGSIWRIVKK